jgi:hypothetical protein
MEIITEVSNPLTASLIVHSNQFPVLPSRNCSVIYNMGFGVDLRHSLACLHSSGTDIDPEV